MASMFRKSVSALTPKKRPPKAQTEEEDENAVRLAVASASAQQKLDSGVITQEEYIEIMQMNKSMFDTTTQIDAEEEESIAAAAEMEANCAARAADAARTHTEAHEALKKGSMTQEEFDVVAAHNQCMHNAQTESNQVILNAFVCPQCMAGFGSQEELMEHFLSH